VHWECNCYLCSSFQRIPLKNSKICLYNFFSARLKPLSMSPQLSPLPQLLTKSNLGCPAAKLSPSNCYMPLRLIFYGACWIQHLSKLRVVAAVAMMRPSRVTTFGLNLTRSQKKCWEWQNRERLKWTALLNAKRAVFIYSSRPSACRKKKTSEWFRI
jgi:hypothetical protein